MRIENQTLEISRLREELGLLKQYRVSVESEKNVATQALENHLSQLDQLSVLESELSGLRTSLANKTKSKVSFSILEEKFQSLLDCGTFQTKTYVTFEERGYIPYEQLRNKVCADIDPTKKEEFLRAEEFLSVFGLTKQQFYKQPKWRRDKSKKEFGLF